MTVKEYTKEFYRLNIRVGHHESANENVAKYMNVLIYEIQYEMIIVTIRNVEDAYQIYSKEEAKLAQNQGQKGIGRSQIKGKEIAQDRVEKPKDEENKPHNSPERGGSSQGRQYGDKNTFPRERGRGRGKGGEINCFVYGKIEHKYFECPDIKRYGGGEAHISEAQR
jgi:hypothetical protein